MDDTGCIPMLVVTFVMGMLVNSLALGGLRLLAENIVVMAVAFDVSAAFRFHPHLEVSLRSVVGAAIADTTEPEDFTTLLNSYLDEMSKIALAFGGTINKFIGDAIVVFLAAVRDAIVRKRSP